MKQTPCTAGRIVTGAEYVRQITALESDRRARSAFQDLAVKLVPPGLTLFDFGSGAGTDARFYAERGFTVVAYDVDAQMCEFFAAQCRDLIDAGRVRLEGGAYREFLARESVAGARAVALVTSNFAPLNLIEDLTELFAKFASLTGPDGKVLASVLSPYFIGDLRYGWWWRNVLRLWRAGRFSVAGAQAPIVRRRLADFAAQSAPHFRLTRVFRGLPLTRPVHGDDAASGHPRGNVWLRGSDAAPGGPGSHAWLRMTRCRYMFLLFEKAPFRQ